MVENLQDHGRGVQDNEKEWQAVSLEVSSHIGRYNHQLAVNIKNNQWTEEETKILLHNQR